MSFGMKILQLQTRNFYTIETLYEAIKDKKFTAGQPYLVNHCSYNIIVFPPQDKRNQVWITPAAYGSCNTWYVQRQEMAGSDSIINNAITNQLTFGISGIAGRLNQAAQYCEWLVDVTANELYYMGL